MKIAYITNVRIPTEKAHGFQITKMCEKFASAGAEVELIVPTRKNDIGCDVFDYYKIEKNFKIRYVKVFDFLPFDKFLFKQAFFINTIFFFLKILFLKLDKESIVYTRSPEISWLFGIRGYKSVYETHLLPKSKKGLFKILLSKTGLFVAITRSLKNLLLDYQISEEKILVAPDGVDLEKFSIPENQEEARVKVNLPMGKKIITYTGSFFIWQWKGVDLILNAVKYFSKDYLFVLVGGKKEEVDEMNAKFKDDRLLFLEKVPHGRIPFYLKSSDVLVLPNKRGDVISELYTSPLKLFEYMASGVPIVASDLPSIKEILNESNSYIFEANDEKNFAEKIGMAVDDVLKSKAISRKALADVAQYTWSKRSENIINFLK